MTRPKSAAMTIRHAHRDDLQALSALAVETFRDAFGGSFSKSDLAVILQQSLSQDRFSAYLEEDVVLLSEAGQRLIGFAQFGPVGIPTVEATEADRELRRLYVLSGYHNRCIGGALMDAVLAQAQMSGAGDIYLDVWEHNHGAQRFYRRYGFEVIGAHSLEVASGADTTLDLIMVRRQGSR